MSIVRMNKFTVFIIKSRKDALLDSLHKFQGVEFINLSEKLDEEMMASLNSDSEEERLSAQETALGNVKYAIENILKYIPPKKGLKNLFQGKTDIPYQQLKEVAESIDWKKTYTFVSEMVQKLGVLKSEAVRLQGEIGSLKPWISLGVPLEEWRQLHKAYGFLGKVSKSIFEPFREALENEVSPSYMEVISEEKTEINLAVLVYEQKCAEAEEVFKRFAFSKILLPYEKAPSEVIAQYNKRLGQIKVEETACVAQIAKMAKKIEELKIVYEYFSNEIQKANACNNFISTKEVLAIDGWIPKEAREQLDEVIQQTVGQEYYLEFREPEEGEAVPILLENNKVIEAFEPVTTMYSLPSYAEIDPTPILAIFLFVFFGMMMSDVGYGVLIFIGSLWALRKLPLDAGKRKLIKMFFFLSISTTFFGALYGSYFGDALSGFTKPLWLDPTSNPIAVLSIAIVMGIVHLFVGLGIKGYLYIRRRQYLDAIFDVGFWYLTLSGAFLIFLGVMPIGKYAAIVGAVGLVLTQGRQNKTVVGKLAGGLFGLYGITGYLGDILSYSRLLALGLATGLIGSSFNLMIGLLGNPVLKFTFGALIFIGGHVFNLLINMLGAYVHSARLQYLEFFNKFYQGGGKEFTPFKPKNKYFHIVKE